MGIGPELLTRCGELALAGLEREVPYLPQHVWTGEATDGRSPKQHHPVFYGCFDWHSAVHAHWTLVRVLRLADDPDAGPVPDTLVSSVRGVLDRQLRAEPLAQEARYLREHPSFERPYGWAWALGLAAEVARLDPGTEGSRDTWLAALTPLARVVGELTCAYLPRLKWPVRHGTHMNTAFALGLMHDATRVPDVACGDALREAIERFAHRAYGFDRDWALRFEPSGEDFLSPGLSAADLMRRVLPRDAFGRWLDAALPGLASWVALRPVLDVEVSDGRLTHLAGLNLSRAWMLRGVAGALAEGDERVEVLGALAEEHLGVGLEQVFTGDYAGEHWLGTFAVLGVSGA